MKYYCVSLLSFSLIASAQPDLFPDYQREDKVVAVQQAQEEHKQDVRDAKQQQEVEAVREVLLQTRQALERACHTEAEIRAAHDRMAHQLAQTQYALVLARRNLEQSQNYLLYSQQALQGSLRTQRIAESRQEFAQSRAESAERELCQEQAIIASLKRALKNSKRRVRQLRARERRAVQERNTERLQAQLLKQRLMRTERHCGSISACIVLLQETVTQLGHAVAQRREAQHSELALPTEHRDVDDNGRYVIVYDAADA